MAKGTRGHIQSKYAAQQPGSILISRVPNTPAAERTTPIKARCASPPRAAEVATHHPALGMPAGPSHCRLVTCWRPARLPSRPISGEAPLTQLRIAALVSCADLHEGLRPLRGKFRITILALMVHHNKGWEIFYC